VREEEDGAEVFRGVVRSVPCADKALGGTAPCSASVSVFLRSDLRMLQSRKSRGEDKR
jgi:hypothetical protein